MGARFRDLVFDDDFLTAARGAREVVRFTRQERTILAVLAGSPSRLFTRAELYDALGSRGSDRNVDFVINRLRAKLGDSASERRFISTQYGEGYVWVAAAEDAPETCGFLAIGPVRGEATGLERLRAALEARLGPGRRVAFAAERDASAAARFEFSLEISAHAASGRTHAGFVLRREPSRELVASFRESFVDGLPAEAAEGLAGAIVEAAWKQLALGRAAAPAPTDEPLHLRMHNASVLLDPPGATWLANGDQLARLRARNPGDATLAIMWAMHLFVSTVLLPTAHPLTRKGITAIEDEIEALVLPHLPAVRDDPILALAAAKMLLLIKRGHEDLAESLATRAFAGSSAFAAALPMLGQVHAFRGEMREARELYDEGLRLCAPGSVFEIYILVLKAMSCLAEADYAAVEPLLARMVQIDPAQRDRFGVFCLPPGDDGLARSLAPLVDRLDIDAGRRVISYLHFRVADLFLKPEHSANVMRGPLSHLVRSLGPTVASEEIWDELAPEFQHLRRSHRGVA